MELLHQIVPVVISRYVLHHTPQSIETCTMLASKLASEVVVLSVVLSHCSMDVLSPLDATGPLGSVPYTGGAG